MDTSPGTTAPGCTPNSDKHANAQLGTRRILHKQAPLLPRRVGSPVLNRGAAGGGAVLPAGLSVTVSYGALAASRDRRALLPGAWAAGGAGGGHADPAGLIAGVGKSRAFLATSFAVRLCASALAFE